MSKDELINHLKDIIEVQQKLIDSLTDMSKVVKIGKKFEDSFIAIEKPKNE